MHDRYDEQLLLAFIEGELSETQRAEVEAWAAGDPRLARLLEQMRADRETLRAAPEPAPPAWIMEEVDRHLERSMLLDDAAGDDDRAGTARKRHVLRRLVMTGGIAAMLAVVAGVILQSLQMGAGDRQVAMREPQRQAEPSAPRAESEAAPPPGSPADPTAVRVPAPEADVAAELELDGDVKPEAEEAPGHPRQREELAEARARPGALRADGTERESADERLADAGPRSEAAPGDPEDPGRALDALARDRDEDDTAARMARLRELERRLQEQEARRRARDRAELSDAIARGGQGAAGGYGQAMRGEGEGEEGARIDRRLYGAAGGGGGGRALAGIDAAGPADDRVELAVRQLQQRPQDAPAFELRIVSDDPDVTQRLVRAVGSPGGPAAGHLAEEAMPLPPRFTRSGAVDEATDVEPSEEAMPRRGRSEREQAVRPADRREAAADDYDAPADADAPEATAPPPAVRERVELTAEELPGIVRLLRDHPASISIDLRPQAMFFQTAPPPAEGDRHVTWPSLTPDYRGILLEQLPPAADADEEDGARPPLIRLPVVIEPHYPDHRKKPE